MALLEVSTPGSVNCTFDVVRRDERILAYAAVRLREDLDTSIVVIEKEKRLVCNLRMH